MSSSLTERRIVAVGSIGGSILLLVGTYLHPVPEDPNDAIASFTAYSADHLWVASHLTQLLGIVLILAALLIFANRIEAGSANPWPRIAAAGAIASLAVATALQAVDGVALKAMVDAWRAAPPEQREAAFRAAFAVRQVEIGLASTSSILLGLTVIVYGIALFADRMYPNWLGLLAIVGGVPATVAGVAMAYTGFSGLAMAIGMPANSLVIVWVLAIGIFTWSRSG